MAFWRSSRPSDAPITKAQSNVAVAGLLKKEKKCRPILIYLSCLSANKIEWPLVLSASIHTIENLNTYECTLPCPLEMSFLIDSFFCCCVSEACPTATV